MQRQRRTAGKNRTPAQKMAKNMTVFAGVMCFIIVGIMFVYYQHKNSDLSAEADTTKATEVQKLASKDLEAGYPETPAEVMKMFGRINQCMYNEGMGDEEFDTLLNQLRTLYSQSLLEENPFEKHKSDFQKEKENFSSEMIKIANYTVDKSSSVKYKEINGQECAYIQMSFFLSGGGKYSKSFQDYILVKEEKKWKILAFKKNTDAREEES